MSLSLASGVRATGRQFYTCVNAAKLRRSQFPFLARCSPGKHTTVALAKLAIIPEIRDVILADASAVVFAPAGMGKTNAKPRRARAGS